MTSEHDFERPQDERQGSGDPDGRSARDAWTPLYTPGAPGARPPEEGAPSLARRGQRNGPLSARLSQRVRDSNPPSSEQAATYTPHAASPATDPSEPASAPGGDYIPSHGPTPTWGRVTGMLKMDENVTGALYAGLQFGATWGSRSEMLRACLDEYYRLVASFNESRRLLEQSAADIETLRRERAAAEARLREVESRLEFHSRADLRAIYLGAAETETRHFRAEEERRLLASRVGMLEGFMAFLSRIIATVRAIPADVVIGGGSPAPSASGTHSQETLLASPTRERRHTSAGGSGKRAKGPEPSAASPASPGEASPDNSGIEEFILDERDVALLASSEFEIIEIVPEPEATVATTTPGASDGPDASASDGQKQAASGDERGGE